MSTSTVDPCLKRVDAELRKLGWAVVEDLAEQGDRRALVLERIVEDPEVLEDLRSIVQLCAHEMEKCGQHKNSSSRVLEQAQGAMDWKVLKESPFFKQPIKVLEMEIAQLKEELKKFQAKEKK